MRCGQFNHVNQAQNLKGERKEGKLSLFVTVCIHNDRAKKRVGGREHACIKRIYIIICTWVRRYIQLFQRFTRREEFILWKNPLIERRRRSTDSTYLRHAVVDTAQHTFIMHACMGNEGEGDPQKSKDTNSDLNRYKRIKVKWRKVKRDEEKALFNYELDISSPARVSFTSFLQF